MTRQTGTIIGLTLIGTMRAWKRGEEYRAQKTQCMGGGLACNRGAENMAQLGKKRIKGTDRRTLH